jgi:hypothetical protein
MSTTRYCQLSLAAEGLKELCTGEVCPFWEPGGAVVAGGCVIERLGTDVRRGDLAAYLLDIRERLESVRSPRTANERRVR